MTVGRSRLALTALQIAVFGVASCVGGVLAVQLGLIAPMAAFTLFGLGTLVCGMTGVALGIVATLRTRRGGNRDDLRRSFAATALGAGLVLLLMLAAAPGSDAPRINDITTDLADPPAFAEATEVGAYAGRDMSYPAEFKQEVRAAYPDLQPLRISLSADEAFDRALASAEALGWEITHQDHEAGVFDASDTSAVFRFVDDITVRVRRYGTGSRIDVRSKSRDGRGDLGANASRIREFAATIETPAVASR
jgi:uncharacterized protein (DUF1499 family)